MTALPPDDHARPLAAIAPEGSAPKALFLHRGGFGQFEFLGKWLADQGWHVTFGMAGDGQDRQDGAIHIRHFRPRNLGLPRHDFRHALDYAAVNCLGAAELMDRMLHDEGYHPDIVMAHVGWGVGLSVKQIWPRCRYIAYHEWYYGDWNWDKQRAELPADFTKMVCDRMRNLVISSEFDLADDNWCPTRFQASRFPPKLRAQVRVISDGVDCEKHSPDPEAQIDFDWVRLPKGRKVLTYATRGMEPLRGFPQFLRGLERLQRQRDDFDTVILANESVSYGQQLPPGDSWWLRMVAELDLDHSRIHVNSMRPRAEYVKVLQASHAHVYFTEPFVTSWSLSEALAIGALIIGSNTAPVTEMVEDMENGIIVDMDDPDEIAEMIAWVFDNPDEAAALRQEARRRILDQHEAGKVFQQKRDLLTAMIGR